MFICGILIIIIQQIVTLSKYGHDALYLSAILNRYPAIYVISYVRGKMFKSILEIKVERAVFFLVVLTCSILRNIT